MFVIGAHVNCEVQSPIKVVMIMVMMWVYTQGVIEAAKPTFLQLYVSKTGDGRPRMDSLIIKNQKLPSPGMTLKQQQGLDLH